MIPKNNKKLAPVKTNPNADYNQISDTVLRGYENARSGRDLWLPLWQDAYDHALPQRGNLQMQSIAGGRRTQQIYDATAMDSADQLAASLLGNMTPIWSQWFGLKPGPELSDEEADKLSPILEKAAKTIQDHFDRSNFAMEIHQCYLDLVVGGTASLYFRESKPGAFSAFSFSAVPLSQIVLDEGANGQLDTTYRHSQMNAQEMQARFGEDLIPLHITSKGLKDPDLKFDILEAVAPAGLTYDYTAYLVEDGKPSAILSAGAFNESPFINFRWMKSPGEIYGRSPIMKALPDIKTANKVVELVLKNASIAVSGIWQADDDGVLNPANIQLTPGSIIPKAVGSRGLQPLDMPGNFDVSQLILESLQGRIRKALLTDKLGSLTSPRMSATEVLERSSEMALLLGATYGRLQTELLTPLIKRAFSILKRRGEIPDIALDGRFVNIDYRSPLARSQGRMNVQNTLSWITAVSKMGAEAAATVDLAAASRYLGEALGVPSDLIIKSPTQITDVLPALQDAIADNLPQENPTN